MRKYYDYTVEGWLRIVVVEWLDDDTADDRFGEEIDESELPEDFCEWSSYDRFAHDDCTVNVVSAGGD